MSIAEWLVNLNRGGTMMSKVRRSKSGGGSRYPRPFESGWTSTGSRYIDNGQQIRIRVDEDGFCAERILGPWGVGDLFGEMDYWPETIVWAGTAATLHDLLLQIAENNGLTIQDLLRPITEELDENKGMGIAQYLADEEKSIKKGEGIKPLRAKWSVLFGSYRIPGIHSPKIGPECFYNGLELDFDGLAWAAKLFSDAENLPNLFLPMIWRADTFNRLFEIEDNLNFGTRIYDYLDWSRKEFMVTLIGDDERWRPFVVVDEPDEDED